MTQAVFTYLNIRQSIAILLAKLVVTDILLTIIIIGFYWTMVVSEIFIDLTYAKTYLFLSVFAIIGLIKIILSIYIVLQWLNEYYEITPDYIYHKKGIIFKKTEQYKIDHIRRMDIQGTLLGEIFNYATITLYDIRFNKYLDLYLIHNPQRYARVLKELRPSIETKSDSVKLPFTSKKEDVYDGYLTENI